MTSNNAFAEESCASLVVLMMKKSWERVVFSVEETVTSLSAQNGIEKKEERWKEVFFFFLFLYLSAEDVIIYNQSQKYILSVEKLIFVFAFSSLNLKFLPLFLKMISHVHTFYTCYNYWNYPSGFDKTTYIEFA